LVVKKSTALLIVDNEYFEKYGSFLIEVIVTLVFEVI
jgi:hypothetical protein